MLRACVAGTGPGHLAIIEWHIKQSVYPSILEYNVRPPIQHIKLAYANWLMQQDSDPRTQMQICNRMAEKETNTPNLNELKQYLKKSGPKFLHSDVCEINDNTV